MRVQISNSLWIHRRTVGNVNPEVFIPQSHKHQEGICHSHQSHMVMPALPGAVSEMIQTKFGFYLPIILYYTKPGLCPSYQASPQRSLRIQAGEPKLQWFLTPLRPFYEQLFRLHFHSFSLHQPIGQTWHSARITRTEGALGLLPLNSSFLFSLVGAYNTDVFKPGAQRNSWKEFWDVEMFPGPKTMIRLDVARAPSWEFVGKAEGMSVKEFYNGCYIERAFKKLKEIKPHITKWWWQGNEPDPLLNDKEVVLGAA